MSSFRKLSIVSSVFIAVYLGEIAINIACGPEPDPYDYYVSYFHNNISGDGYVPFSFTNMSFLYEENEPESEALINSREWADYLGKGVRSHDVMQVMYRTDGATDSLIARHLADTEASLPDSLSENTYLKALRKDKAARAYYLFAKETEPYAVVTYQHYWDPNPRDTLNTDEMQELADRALAGAKKSRKGYLKLRYAYQAARMFHYSGAYERCVETYDQYIASSREKSAVKGWALALKAGAIRRLGEPAEAAYLFSKVFTENAERRVQAYKNFHYIDVPFEGVTALAQSDSERAAIWAIRGFNNADFDRHTLESVYGFFPGSPLVGALLTREINKLELQLAERSQYFYGGWWSDYYRPDSIRAKALAHAEWLMGFSRRLASEKHDAEPQLGILAEAYVQWLLGEPSQAEQTLASLEAKQLSERLSDQYRIIDLLLQVHKLTVANTMNEKAMLPALQWLDQKRQDEMEALQERYGKTDYYWKAGGELRFNRTATNLYQSVLAPHFMRQKDTAMAALLMWKGDAPGTAETEQSDGKLYSRLGWPTQAFWQEQLQPGALEQLAAWGRDGLDRPWAPLFQGRLDIFESDEFWDLLGTAYLRVHDYTAALNAFGRLSPEFALPAPVSWYSEEEKLLWPDPFIATINDYPKRFGEETLTKAEFAQTMANLQRRIVEDPDHAADYYFQLANGVYQTGAFGNAWQLISYDWTSLDNHVKGLYYYSGDFHEARQAATWYAKARELSDDPEFQAKCTFMLAKCEQKLYLFDSVREYYDKAFTYSRNQPDPFWVFSQQNPYFKELREKYLNTQFVRTAAAECTYLSDFIAPYFP